MSNRRFSPYPARNEQRLPTLKPTEHPKSRTLRMSPIPTTVNEDGLRNYLNSLACEEGPVKDNVLALSLAPFIECLVATVTFRQDPLVFVQCRPRNIVSITLPSILDKSRDPEEITVDCDFHGITPLYHPPGEPSYDLIAVPGLSAHAFGSWRSRAAGHVMWLRDFLRKDFPNFRILLWGYDSDLQDTAAQNTIRGFARQLLIAAHSARDGDGMDKNRPIIFVAHSLGGLVVKQALVEAAQGTSDNDKAILRSCVGLFFFGVPNQGLNNQNLLSLTLGTKAMPFVHNLMEDSELLSGLHASFKRSYKDVMKSCYVASFYETRDTKTAVMGSDGKWGRTGEPIRMVTQASATSCMPDEEIQNQVAINTDHSDLVKFTGKTDPNYLNVRSKLREMIDQVPSILRERNAGNENKTSSQVYFMVPFARNMQFIGKNGQTSPLKERLDGGNRRGHQRLALWGLGGVGKTQDVLDFVYEYEGTQKSVFWIHAASKLRFEQDYRKLAQLVGIPGNNDPKQDIKPLVKCWFESPHSSEWILVLDNADNILDFYLDEEITDADESGRSAGLAKFLPHGTKGIIIVTTRDYEVADRLAGGMNTLNKQTMDMPKASLLFKQRYSRTVELEDEESISHLLKALHFLPLAIVQVADFLRLNQLVSPSDYLKQFNSTRESQKHLLDKPLTDVRRDPEKTTETILTTFSITFRQIQKQSPLAGFLLNIIACIDRQGIPHELLLHCGLHCEVSGNRDEFAIKEAISKLINFSLLTPVEYGRAYEMHSLVHVSVEAFQSPHEMHAAQESATKALAGILPNGEYNNHTVWRIYLPHASKLLGKVRTESIDTAKIHHHLSWYLEVVGNFSDAECSAQTSVKVHTDLLGQEHPDTLGSMSRLVSTYWRQGRWKEAEELEVRTMEMRKRVLGQEHPDTLLIMNNLALTYLNQGRWKEAEELEVQTMEMRKRVLGQEHPNTLTSMASLASIYHSQGRWKEAEELTLHVLEMEERVLGQEHPDTLVSISILASIYHSQGRWNEAEELKVHVVEKSKQVLGPDHPDTVNSMNCLASTYWSQGRLKEAEDLGLKAMETSTRVLGQEHPTTLTRMHNLAFMYKAQGRIGEATALMASVVAVESRILDTNSRSAKLSTDTLAMWRNEMEMMPT